MAFLVTIIYSWFFFFFDCSVFLWAVAMAGLLKMLILQRCRRQPKPKPKSLGFNVSSFNIDRYDLHVVLDEVYMNCIFEEGIDHYSIFQFKEDEIPDLQKVHFIWTFSKVLISLPSSRCMWCRLIEIIITSQISILKSNIAFTEYIFVTSCESNDTLCSCSTFLPHSIRRI